MYVPGSGRAAIPEDEANTFGVAIVTTAILGWVVHSMRPAGFSGRTQSLEWIRAPDCSPAPRTIFLAATARWMDALWIGNSRLVHSISSHAGRSGLPGRFNLFAVFNSLPFL